MLLYPIQFFDPPQTFNCAVTNIPALNQLPIQVIASSNVATEGIAFEDNTGAFIGVYVGPLNQEKLVCIIGNGKTGASAFLFPKNCRVCLGSMTASAINNGTLIAFLGTTYIKVP